MRPLGQSKPRGVRGGGRPEPARRRGARRFDVFLAHASCDGDQVESIASALKRRGLKPWLDRWHMPPGRVFQDALEEVLPAIRAVAVFVGRGGIGPWEHIELRAAISQFVKRGLPVIPVLLPGTGETPSLPLFLQEFGWVRFVDLDDPRALDSLEFGITGRHPRDE